MPSNLILARVGARRWLARIMITWVLLASAMMFVHTPLEFYVLGVGHLSGWQWLFLLEGLPSVLLGVTVLFYLTDRPEHASWLAVEERSWLAERLDYERRESQTAQPVRALSALLNPLTWALALPYFAYLTLTVTYILWAPLLVRGALGTRDVTTGFVTAGIAVLATATLLIAGARSDRDGERSGYAAFGLALSSAGYLGAAIAPSPLLRIAALALIPIGNAIFMPAF